jgi:hypothetical protein
MAADVRAWLTAYDSDGDALPERDRPRVTGYDLDILSYWYFDGGRLQLTAEPPAMERADFASFVFANAAAVSELATAAGDTAMAEEVHGYRRTHPRRGARPSLGRRDALSSTAARRDDLRAPIRELHGFFPFTTLLAPDEPRYTQALAALVDPTTSGRATRPPSPA